MLQYLPPTPDAATLEAMGWWASGGSLIALAGWAVARFLDLRASPFGGARQWDPPPVEVPGFTPPEDGRKWHSPHTALHLAVLAGLIGAFIGWSSETPIDNGDQIELLAELFVFACAALVLIRTMRDTPVVGEAPPDDPDESPAVRVRNAAFKLAAAAFMLAMVWFTLD